MLSNTKIKTADLVAIGFHVLATVHHLIGIWNSLEVLIIADVTLHPRVLHLVKFAFAFISSWNLFLQLVYFILALSYDVAKLKQNKPKIVEKLENYKGYIFITPYAIFVSASFWIVYYIDRELVLATVLDRYITRWVNHCAHTDIVLVLILEILIARQNIPSIKDAFLGLSISALGYIMMILVLYLTSGQWIYAALEKLDVQKRTVLFIFSYGSLLLLMIIGMAVQNYRNQIQTNTKKPKYN